MSFGFAFTDGFSTVVDYILLLRSQQNSLNSRCFAAFVSP